MQELAKEAIKHKHRNLITVPPRTRGTLHSMTDPITIFVHDVSVATREAISREPVLAPRLIFLKEYCRDTHRLRLHDAVLAEPDMPMEQLLQQAFGGVTDDGQPKRFLAWAEVRPRPCVAMGPLAPLAGLHGVTFLAAVSGHCGVLCQRLTRLDAVSACPSVGDSDQAHLRGRPGHLVTR